MAASMGQFIAALRRANGFTQQEVADRLGISNKAVSRWERDETAPDVTLIPALAELLGVTCDELLKGERIPDTSPVGRSEPRVEKQLKALMNRSLSGFKALIWISIALSAVGLISMFGISYGFYRPVLGFAAMLLFAAAAFVLAAIATGRMRDLKRDNELFESADARQLDRFDAALGTFSFAAFFAVLSVTVLSLPLVCFPTEFRDSVMTVGSYLTYCLPLAAFFLILIYFGARRPYAMWITGRSIRRTSTPGLRLMNALQLGAVVLAVGCFVIAPYFDRMSGTELISSPALPVAGLVFLLAGLVIFPVFLLRSREGRRDLTLPGVRNMLMVIPAFLTSRIHSSGFSPSFTSTALDAAAGEPVTEIIGYSRYDYWNTGTLWLAVFLALLIETAYLAVQYARRRSSDKGEA